MFRRRRRRRKEKERWRSQLSVFTRWAARDLTSSHSVARREFITLALNLCWRGKKMFVFHAVNLLWRAFIYRCDSWTITDVWSHYGDPSISRWIDFLSQSSPCVQTDKALFSPSTPGCLHSVLQRRFLCRFKPHCKRGLLAERVGFKLGSESTVGQMTGALSGLSISILSPPPDSAFSHFELHEERCLSEKVHIIVRATLSRSLAYGRAKFVCTRMQARTNTHIEMGVRCVHSCLIYQWDISSLNTLNVSVFTYRPSNPQLFT